MRKLQFFIISILLYSCTSASIDTLFIEINEFPYKVDSELLEDILHSKYKVLDASFLKELYENVNHLGKNSNNEVIRAIIEIDSLKKNNVSEEQIEEQYWEFQEIKILALNKLTLKTGVEVYIWSVSYSDGNQGPDIIFATVFRNKKPYSCFQLAINSYSSDSPMWSEWYTESEISQSGKVLIHGFHRLGEYDEENDEEDIESWETIEELFIGNGDINIIRNERIDKLKI
ncbi:MAG: hypothetical protein KAR57_01390 [Bacteroidales bacterium]|nr:hypothetical protein [Bacteroidales bacterium]